jgi:hypothetical protein
MNRNKSSLRSQSKKKKVEQASNPNETSEKKEHPSSIRHDEQSQSSQHPIPSRGDLNLNLEQKEQKVEPDLQLPS